MKRRPLAWFLPPVLAILLVSCSETLVEPEARLWVPESLRSTVNDSLAFFVEYLGDPEDVARFAWDFQSDGIFDEIWVSSGQPAEFHATVHLFRNPGEYLTTVQVTTVENQLYRKTIDVFITDWEPTISVIVPERIECGETALLSATVIDDAGSNAWWDLGDNGSPDESAAYSDTLVLETEFTPEGSGIRPVRFTAMDNDGHRSSERHEIIVGLEPEWPAELDTLSMMDQGRWGHASAVYNDRIYVFGGRSNADLLSSVEIYDPALDAWTAGAEMPTPRWLATAYVREDSILVIGGYLANGSVFMTLETYHPDSDTWAAYDPADSSKYLPEARVGFGVDERRETGNEGFLLAFGGSSAGQVSEISMKYRFGTGPWSYDYTNKMRRPRRDMAVVTVDEQTYAIGGSENGATPSAAFEHFNAEGILWVLDEEMPTARCWPAAAVVGRHIYVMGGATELAAASNILEVFDLLTESWYSGPCLPAPRSAASAHAIGERIYLVGGRDGSSELGRPEVLALTPWRCEE